MRGRLLRDLLAAVRFTARVSTPQTPTTRLRFFGQCLLGIFVVGLVTLCGVGLHWNLSTASLIFLLLVVLSALRYGFWQASVISVAAVLMQSYCFAPPAFSFYIADPQNAIAIVVCELTALLVSRLSTRERYHAEEVERQRRSLEQMFAISRGMLLLNLQESPVEEMAELIRKECDVDAVAILNAEHHELRTAGSWPWNPEPIALQTCADDSAIAAPGLSQRPLMVSQVPMGALLVLCSRGSVNPLTMDALASLVALTFERYRSFHDQRTSEAARQTELLRTTVLDGLAHAFKTPLTIIRAASSGLLEMGELDFSQQELTLLIDSQSVLLNELTTRLLQTARMDGEKVAVERELVSMRALIREVAAAVTLTWGEHSEGCSDSPHVEVRIEGESLSVVADFEMVRATVKELLENAAKYSTAGSPILVRASENSKEIMVSVHNRGPVIPLEDRERIFERYYRCPDHRHSAPGTGIGLSVARNAIEAHGGHIWVISGEREGTTFHFSLPRGFDTQQTTPLEAYLCREEF